MRGQASRVLAPFILLALQITVGCVRSSEPLDLSSSDPTHDQATIAASYRQQAETFRRNAHKLAGRLVSYQQIFGPQSDWALGTKLLMQFYEDAAIERERQAAQHDALGKRNHLVGTQ
jgi:hypothetical protein